ncbi:uncharacterized protein EAF02_004709 [Botrytis sinoallii]|uniref:uncharacterized protein n=1 Tax=Botrytis sinoallii TaxID=1463999 RepID=UPI0019001396|nr:uncharacterized protein EAF02_004709 [Botrytis sinoallii]KAF7884373.1 hypothetical protein EAF02_004709 [Botrytis sinoallii]
MVTRSVAHAQKMLLKRHKGNNLRSDETPREHATQREASGILELSPRKDWKARHVYLKGPERSVESIKNVKRYARVDPEYAEQDETQRWRTEHLFDANIKNERQWKMLSRQAYRDLLDDSDSEYDISEEHLGHYDGCIDCYDFVKTKMKTSLRMTLKMKICLIKTNYDSWSLTG